ncbi:MAG: hypothetical protein COA79_24495 [Planctomycetota bacterium]|nr:MAG: hypothetical protein COA79_24495 [Planctomycetota bacterium]
MKNRKDYIYKNSINCPIGTINFAGYHTHSPSKMNKMRYLGKYAFAYLIDGAGFYYDEFGNKENIESGDFIMVYPDTGHCYGAADNTTWETLYFVFEGQIFDYLRANNILNPKQPIFTLKPQIEWRRKLLKLMDDFRKAKPSDTLTLIIQLQEIISHALKTPKGLKQIDKSGWVQKTIAYIKEYYLEEINYQELASHFNINYDTFRKYFKNEMGLSLTKFQLSLVMEKAGFYLCEENLSVKETSNLLNYCDEFHFSKQFKKTTGMSPRQYKLLLHTKI